MITQVSCFEYIAGCYGYGGSWSSLMWKKSHNRFVFIGYSRKRCFGNVTREFLRVSGATP